MAREPLICRRIHFFELHDQVWYPAYFRQKLQDDLLLSWIFRLPYIKERSNAHLLAEILLRMIPANIGGYTFVDFCAGAGGPTPVLEQILNREIAVRTIEDGEDKEPAQVQFLLTDLYPHIHAWQAAARRSDNLGFIKEPVNALAAPRKLLMEKAKGKKIFRMFNLCFHHFDDPAAKQILRDAIEHADGFGIFELTQRTRTSLIACVVIGLVLLLITPFYFWDSPGHLFFTYVIPIIPLTVVFDGVVSSLRTRSPEEILDMLQSEGLTDGWKFQGAVERNGAVGNIVWFVGIKDDKAQVEKEKAELTNHS